MTAKISGTEFTRAALMNMLESGITNADMAAGVVALRSGRHTKESLIAHCLDGSDPDRAEGWIDYVNALVKYVAD